MSATRDRPGRRWTAEEVRAMQREDSPAPRYELIDGELFLTPSPTVAHQRAVLELALLLRDYLERHDLGEVLISPADIGLEPESVVQPDVFVIPRRADVSRGWRGITTLLLAVEVLSPSTARADRVKKRHYFTRNRVPEYWIVDTDARVVERWRSSEERGAVVESELSWNPPDAGEPLVIDLERFFARVHRDSGDG